jgi:Sec-independent protein translocase protein TatA
MDNIFGIGLPEFILIIVIAGMVMGPERIARSMRTLGRLTARLQAVSRSFLRQLNAELDSVDQDGQLRSTVEELQLLRRQVAELRDEVFTLAGGTAEETRQIVLDTKREMRNSIAPPGLFSAPREPESPTPNPAPVYRPPSLLASPGPPAASNGRAADAPPAPARLPKRVSVAEDPDE